MKILITGKNGQLGQELQLCPPADAELVALGRDELDISDREQVFAVLDRERPSLVINAAAYTAVDKAESDIEQVYAINANGAENLALACKEFNIRLIHVSTDFVFSGDSTEPYKINSNIAPLGVYGESKAAGEAAVLAALPSAVILRTAWVYSSHGGNFVNTMLRLMGERDQLGVVADQRGTPTATVTLAGAIYKLVQTPAAKGIYHCTDAGETSWYDFAVAIFEEGKAAGLLPADKQLQLNAITTADYPTPAKRPVYSVLDKSRLIEELGIELSPWRQVLKSVLATKTKLK